MIETPRYGDDPFIITVGFNWMSDECIACGRLPVMLEIFTIAEVFPARARRKPVAVFVANDQTMNTIQSGLARRKNILELGKNFGTSSVGLQAADGAQYAGIQQVETIFCMLRQRTGQVGHVHFRIRQDGRAQAPLPRGAHPQNGHADQHDKRGRQQRQPRQAGFAIGDIHRVRFSMKENSHARLIYL
jgi:hypothetical protein